MTLNDKKSKYSSIDNFVVVVKYSIIYTCHIDINNTADIVVTLCGVPLI